MQDWSIAEVCAVLGVSRSTEYRWRQAGNGPAYTLQIGKHTYIRYPVGPTLLWISKHREDRAEAAIGLWLASTPEVRS